MPLLMTIDLPPLERPRFFDGERLTASDLLAAQVYERELRWLHNRSLHSWGIAVGLAAAGARGDRSVAVGAGYALDCRGRDLIVAEPVSLQVPPVAGDGKGGAATYLLTVSYLDDEQLPAEQRAGVCGTSGAVRLAEQALLRWQSLADTAPDTRYRPGLDVVVASVSIKGCKLAAAPSTAERQDAAVARPYVGAGRTEAGSTVWRQWPASATPLGVSTIVSTADAGFGGVPRYQAQVVGERTFSASSGTTDAVDGFADVTGASASSFEVRVLLPRGAAGAALNPPEVFNASFLDRLGSELDWYVTWIGIET
jgi:hypothetical protein